MRRIGFIVFLLSAVALHAQERGMFSRELAAQQKAGAAGAKHSQTKPAECRGPIALVTDVGFEGLKTTSANYAASPGGGEGGRFDKTPVLSTRVELREGCLNAHFSALVGSRQTYGGASAITMFQVTLTPAGGGPQHMYGHYETPYGIPSPAVAIEAERDVDQFAANFFQRIGKDKASGDVPPGVYRVDVWWAGGPVGGGGAIGAAFVLKLYQGK
ncbi:MAG TPA: hypothetical protein VNI54_01660 [Thermoanaerobaculia bacterium]|nr:hypothetical protein [Thermoanaerobaculia bacterium]